jgi:hypothetical protein
VTAASLVAAAVVTKVTAASLVVAAVVIKVTAETLAIRVARAGEKASRAKF